MKLNISRRMEPVLLCVIALVMLLPFSDKAFHTDAAYYLDQAAAIRHNPLRPYDFTRPSGQSGWALSYNPPLGGYMLAGMTAAGEREIPLHLAYFAMAVASLLFARKLAEDLGRPAFLSGVLILTSPLWFVNATEIVMDVPLFFFWMAATAAYVHGLRSGKSAWLWVAGALAAAAALTKYPGLLLVPILAAYKIICHGGVSGKSMRTESAGGRNSAPSWWMSLLVPVVVSAGWLVLSRMMYGQAHFSTSFFAVGFNFSLGKVFYQLAHLGGVVLFPGITLYLLLKEPGYGNKLMTWLALAAAALLFATLTVMFILADPRPAPAPRTDAFLLAFNIVCGLAWIGICVKNFSSPEEKWLCLWSALVVLFYLSVYKFSASRYLMPVSAPLCILAAGPIGRLRAGVKYSVIAATAAFALLLGASDAELAGVYRKAPSMVLPDAYDRPARCAASDAFNHSFEYYMRRNGITALSPSDAMPGGGWLVTCRLGGGFLSFQNIPEGIRSRLKPAHIMIFSGISPLATWTPDSMAGFHGNIYGLMPFGPSRTPLDEFMLYEVAPLRPARKAGRGRPRPGALSR